MRRIGGIHTFEDQGFLRAMTRTSAAVLAAGAVLGALWFALGAPGHLGLPAAEVGQVLVEQRGPRLFGALPPSVTWWLAGAAALFASLAVHESVHGLFFKLLAPAGARVTFGANWRAGMLYACAEGIVYTRRRYLAIALAPTALVTALALALACLSGWPVLWYAVAVCHLSGCTGDWGYVRAILADRRIAYCEDTERGVLFFAAGDDGPGDTPAGGEPGCGGDAAPGDTGGGAVSATDGGDAS